MTGSGKDSRKDVEDKAKTKEIGLKRSDLSASEVREL